jgi:hypothetical protein
VWTIGVCGYVLEHATDDKEDAIDQASKVRGMVRSSDPKDENLYLDCRPERPRGVWAPPTPNPMEFDTMVEWVDYLRECQDGAVIEPDLRAHKIRLYTSFVRKGLAVVRGRTYEFQPVDGFALEKVGRSAKYTVRRA